MGRLVGYLVSWLLDKKLVVRLACRLFGNQTIGLFGKLLKKILDFSVD